MENGPPSQPPGAGIRAVPGRLVTTTDGRADPIVWMLGAEGDGRLHAFRGDMGEPMDLPGMRAPLAGQRRFRT
jgi:hypothetical protein